MPPLNCTLWHRHGHRRNLCQPPTICKNCKRSCNKQRRPLICGWIALPTMMSNKPCKRRWKGNPCAWWIRTIRALFLLLLLFLQHDHHRPHENGDCRRGSVPRQCRDPKHPDEDRNSTHPCPTCAPSSVGHWTLQCYCFSSRAHPWQRLSWKIHDVHCFHGSWRTKDVSPSPIRIELLINEEAVIVFCVILDTHTHWYHKVCTKYDSNRGLVSS